MLLNFTLALLIRVRDQETRQSKLVTHARCLERCDCFFFVVLTAFLFQLTKNGHLVRMIPSLSGGLYKFNGDFVEVIPVTADDLLHSSVRFGENLVMTGRWSVFYLPAECH